MPTKPSERLIWVVWVGYLLSLGASNAARAVFGHEQRESYAAFAVLATAPEPPASVPETAEAARVPIINTRSERLRAVFDEDQSVRLADFTQPDHVHRMAE